MTSSEMAVDAVFALTALMIAIATRSASPGWRFFLAMSWPIAIAMGFVEIVERNIKRDGEGSSS